MNTKKNYKFYVLALIPFFIIVLLFEILPLINIVIESFSKRGGGFTIEHFVKIFSTRLYQQSIFNSLWISLFSAIAGIVIAFIAAKAMSNASPKIRSAFTSVLNITSNFAGVPLAFAFMIFTNLLVVSLAGGIATNEEANRSMISVMPVFSVISMAIVGPFIEEVLFRKGFRKAFKNDKAFMIFTALLFGGAHLLSAINLGTAATNPAQLLYIIPYSGLGYFFAKSYVETDTIFTSVVTHILHNSLSVFLILLVGAGV